MKDYEKPSNPTTPAKWFKSRQPGKYGNLRLAVDTDISALSCLYAVCFGDEESEAEDFLRFFFSQPDFMMLLATKNERIVSMISLIPAHLAIENGEFCRGFYLYGIGTLPQYRKQGFSNRLMACARELTTDLGYDFLMLVPASKNLVSFYEKQGFTTHFPKETPQSNCSFTMLQNDCSNFSPISIKEYLSLRKNLENCTGVFSLSESFVSRALEMVAENLRFYKRNSSRETGLCFYTSKEKYKQKEPSLHFLEQTVPFPNGAVSGGLIHQIYALRPFSLPDLTYFQFPLDDFLTGP